MTEYRIPIFYDASHYRDEYVEGKDVGTWMTATLEKLLTDHGFQSKDPGSFLNVTDEQKDSTGNIFVGRIVSADGLESPAVSIKGAEPRELVVSFEGQAAGTASNDEIIEEYYKLLEKSYFTRSKYQFVKEESVDSAETADNTDSVNKAQPLNKEESKGGCYIATAVYGSYDCPEVWTLRRYRDDRLLQSACGRLFVKAYYAVSPAVVKLFGETEWFNCFWRTNLDRMVDRLKSDGYKDSPYTDR